MDNLQKVTVTTSYPSTLGLLFVAFVVLKLTHVIDWSWWWVCAPIWIPISIVLGVVVLLGILWGVCKACGVRSGSRFG